MSKLLPCLLLNASFFIWQNPGKAGESTALYMKNSSLDESLKEIGPGRDGSQGKMDSDLYSDTNFPWGKQGKTINPLFQTKGFVFIFNGSWNPRGCCRPKERLVLYFSDFSKWDLMKFSVLQCVLQSQNHCFSLPAWKQRSFYKAAWRDLAEIFCVLETSEGMKKEKSEQYDFINM